MVRRRDLDARALTVPPAGQVLVWVGELADLRTRLDLLEAGGDPGTEVRAVFSWSYRHLAAEDARTFRLLGLHPGPDLDPYATAALTGATVPRACRALDVLDRAHLIQPAGPGRHGMHALASVRPARGPGRGLARPAPAEWQALTARPG